MNVRAHVQSLIMGVVVGCLSLSGCQFAPKSKSWSWPWSKKSDESKLPDRMLPIWTDTVLHQPNQPGLRGFGGRLFFYREGNPEPIEVEGGLAVYVFDADKLSPQQPNPEKKFVFTAEQFASHMSQSSMGPSYSVWLPWDEVGGPNRKLSLVARFEGSNGGTVISEPTIKLLPGVGSASTESNNLANDSKGVQQASHFEPTDDAQRSESTNRKKGRKTVETIELPPSFQRHWQSSSVSPSNTSLRGEVMSGNRETEPSTSTNAPQEWVETGSEPALGSETKVYDYRNRRYPARTLGIPPSGPETVSTDNASNADQTMTERNSNMSDASQTVNSNMTTDNSTRSRWNGQKRMFRESPNTAGWIPSLPRTPR